MMQGIIEQITNSNLSTKIKMEAYLKAFKTKIETAMYLTNPKDEKYEIKVINVEIGTENYECKVDLKFEKGDPVEFISNLVHGYFYFDDWSFSRIKYELKNFVITDKMNSLKFELGGNGIYHQNLFDHCSLIFSSKDLLLNNEILFDFFVESAKIAVREKSKNKYSIVNVNPEKFEYDICQIK